jgi:hypothetical protein
MKKPIDPKETYVVRRVLCCGEGHCVGVRYTHWESGEACIMGGHEDSTNEECHLYSRLVLVPMYRGDHSGTTGDHYSPENGGFWEFANRPENENKWCHFPLAPAGLHEGQTITPQQVSA